jgi:hypothetical protein
VIAVAGLTVAVVILANDNDGASSTSSVALRAPLAGSSSATAAKHEAATAAAIGLANRSSVTETKDESATAAAIGQSNDGTVTRGSKTDPHGPASLLR